MNGTDLSRPLSPDSVTDLRTVDLHSPLIENSATAASTERQGRIEACFQSVIAVDPTLLGVSLASVEAALGAALGLILREEENGHEFGKAVALGVIAGGIAGILISKTIKVVATRSCCDESIMSWEKRESPQTRKTVFIAVVVFTVLIIVPLATLAGYKFTFDGSH